MLESRRYHRFNGGSTGGSGLEEQGRGHRDLAQLDVRKDGLEDQQRY